MPDKSGFDFTNFLRDAAGNAVTVKKKDFDNLVAFVQNGFRQSNEEFRRMRERNAAIAERVALLESEVSALRGVKATEGEGE